MPDLFPYRHGNERMRLVRNRLLWKVHQSVRRQKMPCMQEQVRREEEENFPEQDSQPNRIRVFTLQEDFSLRGKKKSLPRRADRRVPICMHQLQTLPSESS